MSVVAFVQTYPYEERYGGDAEYILRLAQYFQSEGHDVHFLISDIHRGRTLPFYLSPYPIDEFRSYSVRRGARVGRLVTNLSPAHPFERFAQRYLPATRLTADAEADTISDEEADWLVRRVAAMDAKVVVLCFGAATLAPRFAGQGRCVVALPSALPGRDLTLKGAGAFATSSVLPPAFVQPLTSADIIVVNADDEAQALQVAIPGAEIVVAKIGSPFHESRPEPGTANVLFVGNETGPNIEAARWFLAEVWPRVLQTRSEARFRLVGRVVNAYPSGGPNVDLVGPVQDIAAEYRNAQLVVAPLRHGSAGVKIKVAEAISFGCPLVTTAVGVDAADPGQIDEAGFVANTPDDFADRVCRLLADPELRAVKAKGARNVHARHFSNEASYGLLGRRIDAINGRQPARRPGRAQRV